MAEYKFLAAINPADFPLVTRFQPRTVIIPGLDNRLRQANTVVKDNEVENNPQNFPQIMYCENIMPSTEGVFSVGYKQVQNEVALATAFDDVFILRKEDELTALYSPALGLNYVTSAFGVAWTSTDPLATQPTNAPVSMAYVNGITYICFAGEYLLRWTGTNFIDESAALLGVAIADVIAITGSGNYLVLLCEDLSFKWSSLVNPLDFVVSASTGAGSQIPVDVRGAPITLTAVSGGVLIHCAQNTVAALATNNSAQPWTFREVKNAGGIASRKNVSTDNNSGATYIWGTNGFQRVGLREADSMFPTVTDFLAGRILETFDYSTNLLTTSILAVPLLVKVAYISGRYIVISYGIGAGGVYDYALIYDNDLKRWGKLKRSHVDCFSSNLTPRNSISFLSANGTVNEVQLYSNNDAAAGVIIMGRYQINRTNQICSQEVELEVLTSSNNPVITVVTNYNGTTLGQLLDMLLYENTVNYRKYQKQIEGENLSYVIKGSFAIASMIVTVTKGARF